MNIVVLLVTLLVVVIIAIIVLIIVMYILKKKSEQCNPRRLNTKLLDKTSGNSKASQDAVELVTSVLMKLILYLKLEPNTPELDSFVEESKAKAAMGDEIFVNWLVDKYENHVPQKGQESNMADVKEHIIDLADILDIKPQWKKTCSIESENQLTKETLTQLREQVFEQIVGTFVLAFGAYLGEIDPNKTDCNNDILKFRTEVSENLNKAKFGNWVVTRFKNHRPNAQQAQSTETVLEIIADVAKLLGVQKLNWTDVDYDSQRSQDASEIVTHVVQKLALYLGIALDTPEFTSFVEEFMATARRGAEIISNWLVDKYENHIPQKGQESHMANAKDAIILFLNFFYRRKPQWKKTCSIESENQLTK